MKTLSSTEALKLIQDGQQLKDIKITEKFDLSELEVKNDYSVHNKISIINCEIEYLMAHSSTFVEKFELQNCHINKAYFGGGYFPKGFDMKDCKFTSLVSFEAGGHNMKTDFVIENNLFKDFVDFLDCCFDGPFILRNNIFELGTNIFVEGIQESSLFNDIVISENNTGNLKQERFSIN